MRLTDIKCCYERLFFLGSQGKNKANIISQCCLYSEGMSVQSSVVPQQDLDKLQLNPHANGTACMEISLNIGSMSSVWGSCDVSGLGASLSGVRLSKLSNTLHCAMQTYLNS